MILPTAMTSSRPNYADSHPSVSASMDDFEAREFSPTIPEMPSQHSGFRSNNASEYSESNASRRSYSPPAWRKAGSGWFQHQQALSPPHRPHGSKEPSPYYQSNEDDADEDGDMTAYRTARRIPLPESPVKDRSPSQSPEPTTPGPVVGGEKGGGITSTMPRVEEQEEPDSDSPDTRTPTQSNCM